MTTTFVARRLAQLVATLALAGTAVGLSAVAAGAAPGATQDVPAAGLAVQCGPANQTITYTATGGTMHMVNQFHVDATGVAHFTGTVSLQNVTANDGTADGVVYQIVGASWFGGSGASRATTTFRSTDEFNIIGPGGKVASVHARMTVDPDGSVASASLSECQAPA
jgi:hypothetical protein